MTTDRIAEAADELMARVAEEAHGLRRPEATYRIQFHKGFTFRDATALVPYLRDLGISHLYASPYLQARPGSMHGYDITNHRRLNPEVGTEADYDAMVAALHEHGMGQVLDTVPNHMGVLGNDNPWWNDVLENGPASAYAHYFDIAWEVLPRPELHNRLLAPVLGEPYGKALEAQRLRLEFASGAFAIHYYDNIFPVSPCTYGTILGCRLDELKAGLGETAPALLDYLSILSAVGHLPGRTETAPERIAERQREKDVIKRRLAALVAENAPVLAFIQENVALFNGKAGEPASFDLLDKLLDAQAYRLSFWRVASDEINYRRFFDVNELAALSMERPEVFEATHELIFRLIGEGKIDGLRIDHPDGLFDPLQYLERLQRGAYVLERAKQDYESPSPPTPLPRGARGAILLPSPLGGEGSGVRGRRHGRTQPAASPPAWKPSVRKVRYGGRCTSWWRRSSARRSRWRRTGRCTGPAATSSSTRSTTCSWTPPTPRRSRASTSTGARSIPSSR